MDFQVAESMHFDGREADDYNVDGVAEQVLAAALAALGPIVIGIAIPARDPHRRAARSRSSCSASTRAGLISARPQRQRNSCSEKLRAQITLNKLVRTESGSAASDV